MKGRILVVDDERSIVTSLVRIFQDNGYDALGVGSAEEAIASVEKESFDLILLDNVLPGMSGLRAIQELRSRSTAAVVMMTGHFDMEMKKDALLMGALDFLPKPLDIEALERKVAEIVAGKNV